MLETESFWSTPVLYLSGPSVQSSCEDLPTSIPMQRTKGKKEVRNKGGAPDGAVLLEIENQDTKKLEARVARKENLNQLLGDPRNAERKLFPIHFAVEVGGAEIVELLAGGGADVNALDSQGSTPLVGAITADQPQEPIIGKKISLEYMCMGRDIHLYVYIFCKS